MWQYNHTNELKHFGKKGMKWGRRKSAGPNGERVTTTRIPLTTYTKTVRKDGTRQVKTETKALLGGSTKTTVSEQSKAQVMVGRAAVVGILAVNGAVLASNYMKYMK